MLANRNTVAVETELPREPVINPYFPELASPSVSESLSISSSTPLDLPSPPPGIPPPQRGNEFQPTDTSPIAGVSLQREGGGPHSASPSLANIDSSPEADYEVDPSEQAAVGRLASMSSRYTYMSK